MYHGQLVCVKCRISRSAFSQERIFRLKVAFGVEHTGIASVHHLRDNEGNPINDGIPEKGVEVSGYVVVKWIADATSIDDECSNRTRHVILTPENEQVVVYWDAIEDNKKIAEAALDELAKQAQELGMGY